MGRLTNFIGEVTFVNTSALTPANLAPVLWSLDTNGTGYDHTIPSRPVFFGSRNRSWYSQHPRVRAKQGCRSQRAVHRRNPPGSPRPTTAAHHAPQPPR